MTTVDLKKIINKHNRLASAVMNTDYSTPENTVLAYKIFIDENELIHEILSSVIEKSENAPDLFTMDSRFYRMSITTDADEDKNIAIRYKFLPTIAEHENIGTLAFSLFRHSKTFNTAIDKLLEVAVEPIIKYISAKLEDIYLDEEAKERKTEQTKMTAGRDIIYQSGIQGNATVGNTGEITIHGDINLAISSCLDKISECESVSDEEYELVKTQLEEIKTLLENSKSKKKTLKVKIASVLKWVADKTTDVMIAVLPTLITVLSSIG